LIFNSELKKRHRMFLTCLGWTVSKSHAMQRQCKCRILALFISAAAILRKGPENWFLFWPLSQAPRMDLRSSFLPLLSRFHESWVPTTLGRPSCLHAPWEDKWMGHRCRDARGVPVTRLWTGGKCSLQKENLGSQKAAGIKRRAWHDLSCSINKKWQVWFSSPSFLLSFVCVWVYI